MIVSEQIRMARTALRWSPRDLAKHSRVSYSTIRRVEALGGLPKCTKPNLLAIQKTLESAGIEFIGTPEDRPGIRIGKL
jgi:transcriptional regulator with XRE-family HTH domain